MCRHRVVFKILTWLSKNKQKKKIRTKTKRGTETSLNRKYRKKGQDLSFLFAVIPLILFFLLEPHTTLLFQLDPSHALHLAHFLFLSSIVVLILHSTSWSWLYISLDHILIDYWICHVIYMDDCCAQQGSNNIIECVKRTEDWSGV